MIDPSSGTLIDHLKELRNRLLVAICVVLVVASLAYVVKDDIFKFLVAPIRNTVDSPLVQLGVPELFFLYVKQSFLCGLFVGLPVILWQIWRFIAPGLYDGERKVFGPFLFFTPFLFYMGGVFTYYVVLPIALGFFYGFSNDAVVTLPSLKEYLGFLTKMVFAFGLAFELPIFLLILAKVGVVDAAGLAHFRRYAIVCIFVAAAILTPPDPLSQLLLAGPLIVLYEISIIGARFLQQKNAELAENGDNSPSQ